MVCLGKPYHLKFFKGSLLQILLGPFLNTLTLMLHSLQWEALKWREALVRKLFISLYVNPLSANPVKWSNTLKQFVGKLPTNCLSLCDHFVGLVLKGFKKLIRQYYT